jgi:hypothetical protein
MSLIWVWVCSRAALGFPEGLLGGLEFGDLGALSCHLVAQELDVSEPQEHCEPEGAVE